MDQIKFVIDELNQLPFSQNLNLISYDNLQSEQRLDILIQILNYIDPKLNLVSVRVGNIEEIVATILDTLRIFKYTPPANQINPSDFRKNLILADKDLLTNIFEWLLKRLPALKKRAYLAQFLVQIELSPEVEGDQDVLSVYKQYLRLIDEFKKAHSNYESRKKSLDSIIELQKDIKTMEIEKDQIKNKLEVLKRRVNVDRSELTEYKTSKDTSMFEMVVNYVNAKRENEKLLNQMQEQNNRIETLKSVTEMQHNQLSELHLNAENVYNTDHSPDTMLERLKEDTSIKQRLVKDFLPAELSEMRSIVSDIEGVDHQSETVLKEYVSKVNSQIQSITEEIRELMEKKLMEKDSEQDRLSHYRQNAQSVSSKKDQLLQKYLQLEKMVNVSREEVTQLRSQYNDGDLPLHGEALKLYIEKISKRESELEQKRDELQQLNQEILQLKDKVSSLKQQETKVLKNINSIEESLAIEGYLMMRESTLNVVADDNDDGIEDDQLWTLQENDADVINDSIDKLQQQLELIKADHTPVTRDIKQFKSTLHELENEFNMKKRLYDSAAAGLETELRKCQLEWNSLKQEQDKLEMTKHYLQTELIVRRTERDHCLSQTTGNVLLEQLKNEVQKENNLQLTLKQREKEVMVKEDYYRKQTEMWRDLKAIFEIKSKILTMKQEEKTRNDYLINSNVNHLVLN